MTESLISSILNIFIKHYNNTKKLIEKDYSIKNECMFDNMKSDNDINEMMKELFAHIHAYKLEEDDNEKKIYGYDESIYEGDNFYCLVIDDKRICICKYLFPLLEHIHNNIDSFATEWEIIPISFQ